MRFYDTVFAAKIKLLIELATIWDKAWLQKQKRLLTDVAAIWDKALQTKDSSLILPCFAQRGINMLEEC